LHGKWYRIITIPALEVNLLAGEWALIVEGILEITNVGVVKTRYGV